eukprot:Skav221527  [mRNA]  locus=scaffold1248:255206:269023:- [translate_table: standard]
MGNNSDGQLGCGVPLAKNGWPAWYPMRLDDVLDDDDDKVFEATELRSLESATICSCAMSLKHSLRLGREAEGGMGGMGWRWLTADGIVYTAGDNDSGQLGRSGKRTKPFKIDSIEHLPVESVAAGNGFTDRKLSPLPQKLRLDPKLRVVSITSGPLAHHSFLLRGPAPATLRNGYGNGYSNGNGCSHGSRRDLSPRLEGWVGSQGAAPRHSLQTAIDADEQRLTAAVLSLPTDSQKLLFGAAAALAAPKWWMAAVDGANSWAEGKFHRIPLVKGVIAIDN